MTKFTKWLIGTFAALALIASVPAQAVTLYSTNLCVPKPTPGDPASQNTWGALINTGADIIDAVTSKTTSLSVAGAANVVLTFSCGALDQSDAANFTFTGVLTGNIYVLWPATRNRTFSVTNSTTGSFTLGLGANNGAGLPAGTTTTIPQGYTGVFYSDGTNVKTRITSGGLTMAANSVAGNISGSAGPGADLAVPNCTGGLTYATGSGFGCNAGGGGGGGGTGLAWGGTPATNFAAAVNTIYCINTSGGAVTMTLPATPVAGNQIVFIDCAGTFQATALTVANNSNLLMGLNENMVVGTANAASTLVFSGVTLGWRMY